MVETAEYDGPGGELEMYGLYFVDAGQHIEHRLFVDHNAPHTQSHVDYRGALQGQGAHSVWIGDVLIRKEAEGIKTYESNRNLVLTDGCRADSVPNLEIETGEIEGAGHACTTGRFDDEQLFYLRSRGIPEDEARRLVVHGFFADIIRRLGVPEIEKRLLAAVEAELRRSPVGAAGGMSFVPACCHRRRRAGRPLRRRGRRHRDRPRAQQRRGATRSATSAATPRSRCPRATSSDGEIECYLHGSRFDLRTGEPLGLPATEPVAVYPCRSRRRRRPRRRLGPLNTNS